MFKFYYLKSGQIIACVEEDDMLKDILQIRITQMGIGFAVFGYPVNAQLISLEKKIVPILFPITEYNDEYETNYYVAINKLKHPDIIEDEVDGTTNLPFTDEDKKLIDDIINNIK
jgi:hypothetical protein